MHRKGFCPPKESQMGFAHHCTEDLLCIFRCEWCGEIISADVHSDNVTDMYGNIVVLSCGRCCCLWDAH